MICEGRRIDYAALHRVSNQVAHGLQAAGIRAGDRIAYLGKESEHYYELLYGAAKLGAVLVPINWRLAADEVDHILRDSGTRDAVRGHRRRSPRPTGSRRSCRS